MSSPLFGLWRGSLPGLHYSDERPHRNSTSLDFPGAVTQGFDLPHARLMIASALEDLAGVLLEEGEPLPVPSVDVHCPEADLIEIVPLLKGKRSTSVCM